MAYEQLIGRHRELAELLQHSNHFSPPERIGELIAELAANCSPTSAAKEAYEQSLVALKENNALWLQLAQLGQTQLQREIIGKPTGTIFDKIRKKLLQGAVAGALAGQLLSTTPNSLAADTPASTITVPAPRTTLNQDQLAKFRVTAGRLANYFSLLEGTASKFNTSTAFTLALITQESVGDHQARSPTGPRGWFMFTRQTAKRYDLEPADRTNINRITPAGVEHADMLLDRYNGYQAKIHLAALGYNRGEWAADEIIRLTAVRRLGKPEPSKEEVFASTKDLGWPEFEVTIKEAPRHIYPRVPGFKKGVRGLYPVRVTFGPAQKEEALTYVENVGAFFRAWLDVRARAGGDLRNLARNRS